LAASGISANPDQQQRLVIGVKWALHNFCELFPCWLFML
jgi:hypothetical protein